MRFSDSVSVLQKCMQYAFRPFVWATRLKKYFTRLTFLLRCPRLSDRQIKDTSEGNAIGADNILLGTIPVDLENQSVTDRHRFIYSYAGRI